MIGAVDCQTFSDLSDRGSRLSHIKGLYIVMYNRGSRLSDIEDMYNRGGRLSQNEDLYNRGQSIVTQ